MKILKLKKLIHIILVSAAAGFRAPILSTYSILFLLFTAKKISCKCIQGTLKMYAADKELEFSCFFYASLKIVLFNTFFYLLTCSTFTTNYVLKNFVSPWRRATVPSLASIKATYSVPVQYPDPDGYLGIAVCFFIFLSKYKTVVYKFCLGACKL